jgi:D-sedoheptulose 7-phosphate isomerase
MDNQAHNIELARRQILASAELKRQIADTLAEPTAQAAHLIAQTLQSGHKVLVCGNGGSAADAQHLAGELVGRYKLPGRAALPVLSLSTDSSVMTCIANDFSYAEVFSRQVEAFAQAGDLVIGLSTSGGSANVLNAFRVARQRGSRTLALVGGKVGPIGEEADLALVVPSEDTARIQECHITLIHTICEIVEAEIGANNDPRAD